MSLTTEPVPSVMAIDDGEVSSTRDLLVPSSQPSYPQARRAAEVSSPSPLLPAEVVEGLMERVRSEGLELVGEGGVLTQLVSWRWVMFVNVPIGIVVWAIGRIALQDGRTLDPSYREFVPGYAVTSYGSQGRTVDYVLFSDSAVRAATNSRQWYVTISRGRRGGDDRYFSLQLAYSHYSRHWQIRLVGRPGFIPDAANISVRKDQVEPTCPRPMAN